jgi:hypothetical protein
MNYVKITMLIVLATMFIASTSEAGWLIYHKSEFKGKVIDAETKQPLQGAVVVVVYNKTTMGLGAGTISSIIHVREALTDKDGVFLIPSYTTIIQPFSWSSSASFIIFKPGCGTFPRKHAYPPVLSLPEQEIFFSAGVGTERLLSVYVADWKYEYRTLKTGIVELPKFKTREERKQAWMDADIFGADVNARELPLLYKMVNDESKIWF